MTTDDTTISTLNDLIETCKDGEYGFKTCAERVQSASLRSVMSECAQSCREAATELQAEVARLGGKPEQESSISGTMHRGWVRLKEALGGDSDLSILEECERGEDAALARYRDAVKADLPAGVAALVRRQYEGAKRNHDRIRNLRDQLKAVAS
jgi:uncharacterized protein (TIGR02284 family)